MRFEKRLIDNSYSIILFICYIVVVKKWRRLYKYFNIFSLWLGFKILNLNVELTIMDEVLFNRIWGK